MDASTKSVRPARRGNRKLKPIKNGKTQRYLDNKLWIDFKATEAGSAEHIQLRNKLFEKFQHIPEKIARYFAKKEGIRSSISDNNDHLSNAYIGLIVAIEDFNPSIGVLFSTYAYLKVRGAIIDGLRRNQDFPRHIPSSRRFFNKISEEISHELGYTPNFNDLKELIGDRKLPELNGRQLTLDELLKDPLVFSNVFNELVISGDTENASDSVSFMETLYHEGRKNLSMHEPAKQFCAYTRRESIELINSILSNKVERKVIICYYFWGMALADISKTLKISEAWASAKKKSATEKLKDFCRKSDKLVEMLTD